MEVIQLDAALTRKIQDSIQVKLRDFNDGKDDPFLVEYVLLMLGNRKTKEQIAHELDTFFTESNARSFTDWLWDLLLNLTNSTSTTAPTTTASATATTASPTTTTTTTTVTATPAPMTVTSVAHRVTNHHFDTIGHNDNDNRGGGGIGEEEEEEEEEQREVKQRHHQQQQRRPSARYSSDNRMIDLTRKSGPMRDRRQVPLTTLSSPSSSRRRDTDYANDFGPSSTAAASSSSSSITMIVGDDNQPQFFTKKFLATQKRRAASLDREDITMKDQSEWHGAGDSGDGGVGIGDRDDEGGGGESGGGSGPMKRQRRQYHPYVSPPPATYKALHTNRVWYNPGTYSQSGLNYALGQRPNMVWQRPKDEQQSK